MMRGEPMCGLGVGFRIYATVSRFLAHRPCLALVPEDPRSNVIRTKFPTAALAVLDATIDEWRQLEPRPTRWSMIHIALTRR